MSGSATELSRRDIEQARGDTSFMSDARAALVTEAHPLSGLSLLLLLVILGAGYVWADRATLDEVTVGLGDVIPSSREQVIQSLEGGILAEMLVNEGDVVEAGDVLLRLDDTGFNAAFMEGRSRAVSLEASIARLAAEASGERLQFPPTVPAALRQSETALYRARRDTLEQAIAATSRSRRLAEEELRMTEPLVGQGIVSEVEVLRLRRQVNELAGQIEERRNLFRANARAELAEKRASLGALAERNTASEDRVQRTVVRAPMRGTVKNVRVTTVGGVIQPGMEIMELVPLEDRLLVEARIPPANVAFLRPGLPAKVKITAYDYSIYGGLDGQLEHISADTIADESRPEERFYRIRVRTERSALEGRDGTLPIIPGMTASVEILTGQKTVLEYLLKPVLKVRERALRER